MRIVDTYGNPFSLRKNFLSEMLIADPRKIFRSVSRSQIASVLRGRSNFTVDGYSHTGEVWENAWDVGFCKTEIAIGCKIFTGNNMTAIRKWAFAKRRKK
jgi:hypothetical protein